MITYTSYNGTSSHETKYVKCDTENGITLIQSSKTELGTHSKKDFLHVLQTCKKSRN